MVIVFYISLLVSPPFLLIWLAKREGIKGPPLWQSIVSLIAAVPLAFFLLAITTILDKEGNDSLIWIFHIISTAIVLACFSGKKLWQELFVLTIFTLMLYNLHMGLAHSPSYTDNPDVRAGRRKVRNKMNLRAGKPILPKLETNAEWHTWLTRLYAVREKK